ncbi:putative ABC transport system permease protein [Clostridium saccharoperbutylacetonicum]|uniref:ABC-type antimicrobial peptide transport system, permease component n=2 Tax=Clostridium TaxID=1485 RepID=M1LVG9_9CLOT|nr:ABC transporter permease [Clostridium saccharoperbutylacetonicum]AGF57140.1 ABC-type antimicrobial peptide transport system, permease component [Clostridium saccharoperbutylacetonicum N1-4(HMT)]NRT62101.1 putative ABC transport system permease protein [Clostridium saccharoperbutylacetonicum]NSB25431.1 putative ABC transport system permease protein [Clostridium saccharoperbutylacetonicum]NSB44800.1 putative ABC transport system permease protein [Clostridium saccharoperbutylacetonicum]
MFIKENMLLAIAGLKANKMRSLLTMLGIIIGIASVIGVVSVGNTMTSSVTSSMASMGATNITVNVQEKSTSEKAKALAQKTATDESNANVNTEKSDDKKSDKSGMQGGPPGGGAMSAGGQGGPPGGGGMPGGGQGGRMGSSSSSTSDTDLMTMEQINALEENFSDKISSISISESGSSGKVKSDSSYANVSVTGTNIGYQDIKSLTITDGRYLTQNDIDGAKDVAVVSDKLVSKIFGDNVDPIGQKIKFYTSDAIFTYTIVGVYKYQSGGGNRTTSDENLSTSLYIPISVEKKTATNKNYQTFTIKAKDNVDVSTFTTELSTYLSNIYAKNIKFVAQASNMESMLESMTSMLTTVSLAISGIAAISLLVGGIGVMNIMLVSVTERTREIGTRKALGAKAGHIKMQFIVESIIICSIGGILGIALGLGAGTIGSSIIGKTLTVSPIVVLISFSFSMFIGVFFGYYPAKKAAELDPIEALRYE